MGKSCLYLCLLGSLVTCFVLLLIFACGYYLCKKFSSDVQMEGENLKIINEQKREQQRREKEQLDKIESERAKSRQAAKPAPKPKTNSPTPYPSQAQKCKPAKRHAPVGGRDKYKTYKDFAVNSSIGLIYANERRKG